MHYTKVNIAALGYELPANVISSEDLEARLAPLYQKLHLQPGQLETLTGIAERRFWEPDFKISKGAVEAGRKALAHAELSTEQIGMLIYGGVCRENLEPATACAVAH
jgi:3-oxoacyl-[acyl-carrier-protein] synthase III